MRVAGEVKTQSSLHPLDEFIEHFADIVLLVDAGSGRILGCNTAAEHAYGYSRSELCKLTIDLLRSEQHKNTIKLQMAAADSGGVLFETVHRRKDETLFPVEVSSRGTYLGQTRVLVSVVRDTTERQQALATLRESERMFTLAFHSSPGCFAISTFYEGRLIDVNDSFLRLLRLGREDVVGRTLDELGLWNDPRQLADIRKRVESQGSLSGLECAFRRSDGNLGYGLVSATRIEVHKIPCLLTETVDITDRKRAEEQLLFVKTSIDRAPHAAYWMDLDGNFIYVNESGCRMLNYSREELLSMHVSDVNPKASRTRWNEVFRTIKEQGALTLTSEHRRKDGTLIEVELTSSYFTDGSHEYCVGFAVDITERIRAERERELLQSQLYQAQKMESVGRLAGGVAHDFNNMLTIIHLSAQQGLDLLTPAHPLNEELDAIRNAAKRSAALTNQLLAFARKQVIAPRVLNLNETIEGMLGMLGRLLGENLELRWIPDEHLWPVLVDPSQLDQLLANLCVNARDAISDVGVVQIETANRANGTVNAAGLTPGDYVELSVRDTGCGMDERTIAHLFEPFYTTKVDGKGTGLGLATVYGIVKQNGGFIDVNSCTGEGTTFKIFLPREHRTPDVLQTEDAPSTNLGAHTVLVVEDEAAILKLVSRQLGKQGYEVLSAPNPIEAIRVAREHKSEIHLLLTDVVMPEMNGRELAAEVGRISPHLKCLFMSGYTADIIEHHGVFGADVQFIQKPFTNNELIAKVREVLHLAY